VLLEERDAVVARQELGQRAHSYAAGVASSSASVSRDPSTSR
jgi:hypothetical protein